MLIENLIYFLPFCKLSHLKHFTSDLDSVRDTYKILVDLVKSKIESTDYLCIDNNTDYSIHEIFIYDQSVVIKRLLKGFGWDAIGRIYRIRYEKLIPIKDLIDAIIKTMFYYQDYDTLKYLKIQNKYSGNIINELITEKLRNINDFEIFKMGNRIQFKYENISIDNSYLRDILVESEGYFNNSIIKKDNITLINENGKMYIAFFIKKGRKFYVFKIDIQELNCESIFRKQLESASVKKYLDLYTVTDVVLNLYKSKETYLDRSKKSVKIYPIRNFNWENEFVNFMNFFDKSENEKLNFKIMFYDLLKRENLIKRVIYRILLNKESANYLLFIHLIGNIGLIDTSQIIYLTKNSNRKDLEVENIISNFIFDKHMIQKIIKSLEKSEDFDIKILFAAIFFVEANQMFMEYDENISGKIRIFDQFKEINETDDLYTIHKDLFEQGDLFIEEAWKVLSVLLETVAYVTDLDVINYNILGDTIKIERADILKRIEELKIDPKEIINILGQI